MLPERILVGYDGSPDAENALDAAIDLAKAANASLVVVHVVSVTAEVLEGGILDLEALAREAEAMLDAAVAKAREAGVPAEKVLTRGDVARAILKEVQARKADLIVVGSLGRTRMARMLLGSVADKLVLTAPVPVLVVR